jgi:hypothetical protein
VDQIQADLLLALADLGIKNAAEYKESESKVQWAFAEAMKKMERAAREYRRFVFGAGEREPGGQLFDIIYDGRKIVEAKDLSYGETITAMRRIEARLQAWPEDPLDISIDKAESLTKTASQIRDQILAPLNRLANIKETSNDLKYVLTAKDVWDMFLKTAKQPLDPKSPAGKFSSILEDVCSKDLVPMQAGNMTAVTRWKIGTAVKKLRALNFDAAEAPVLQSDLDQFIKALNRPGALDEVIIHMPESEGDFWQAGVEDFRMNGVSYRMLVFYRPEQQKTQRPEDASVLYVKLSSEGRPMRWIKIYRVDQKERMGLPLSTGKPKEIDVIIKKLGISRMMQSQGDPAQKGAQWLNLTKFINALDDADLDDLEVRQLAGDGPVWEAAATGFQMDGISYELIVHYKPGDGKVSRQPQGQSYLFVKLSQQGVRKKFGKFYYTDYMGRFNQPAEPGRPQEIDHIIQKLGIDARIKSAKDAAEIVVTDLMAALKNITGPVSVGLSTVNDDFMGVPKSEGGKIELNGVVHTMTVYDNGDFLNIRLKAANGLEKMLVLYTSRNSDEIAKIRHVVRMDKYKKPIFGHPASIQYVPVREDAITAAPDQRIDLDQFILGLRSMADRTPVEPSEMLWRSKQAAGTAFVNGVRSRVIVHDDEDQLNIEIKVGDELQQRIILRPAQHAAQMQQVREILGLDKVTAQDLFKMRMGRADAAEASAISLDDLMKMLEDMQRSGDVRFREHWIRDCMTADGDAFWNGTSYRVVVNDYGTALDILVVSRKDDVKTQIMLSEAEYSGIIGKIRELFGLPVKEEKDAAMKGGIDFGLSNLDMQIKRDGDGVPLPVSQQDLESIRIDGLVPVILNIQPAANIPLFSDAGGAATPAA